MQLPYEVTVALRYMRSRKKAGISLTSALTIVAFALGVTALTVVTSVWNGFEAEFLDKLLGINAHAVILKRGDFFRDHVEVADKLRADPQIDHVAPFVFSEVIGQSAKGVQGLLIKGVDPQQTLGSPLAKYISKDKDEQRAILDALRVSTATTAYRKTDLPGILIGNDLVEVLHTEPGGVVSIVSPYGGKGGQARTKSFEVVGVFHSGMFEFDSRMVFIDLEEAQAFFRLYDNVTGLEVWTKDPFKSRETVFAAARALDPEDPLAYDVKDWSITNRGIFGAVRSQKVLISIVLFFIVIVASFMILATLILLILEKGREVAILKALGATNKSIRRIFLLDGQIIGLVGCAVGVGLGLAVCRVLEEYGLKLDPRVYYLEHLPIVVRTHEIVGVCVGAMILATLAALIPAWAAARMRPVDGLTRRAQVKAPASSRAREAR